MQGVKALKCVVVGDGAAGKTSLLVRYTTDKFLYDYSPTVFDNYSALSMIDSTPYSLSLWDTAGQEEYDALRPLSYPQTDVFMVCYSTVWPASLTNVTERWLPELRKYAPNTPVVLVGLKADARDDAPIIQMLAQRALSPVTREQGAQVAGSIGAKAFLECSALTGRGVRDAFESAVRATYRAESSKKKKSNNPFAALRRKIRKH
jgi:small GTP-binding protein